jgi:hypothetical protein
MELCALSTILSYIASIYILASIYYIIITRQYGTPFADEVNKIPTLKHLRETSSKKRKKTFYTGLVISSVVMLSLHPFIKCY